MNSTINGDMSGNTLGVENDVLTMCNRLGTLSRQLFFSSFFDGKYNPTCEIILDILTMLNDFYGTKIIGEHVDIKMATIISTIYASLGNMLTCPTNVLSIENCQQSYKQTTIINYLLEIEKKDVHAFIENHHRCPHHMEDLFTHLHLSLIISLFNVIKSKPDVATHELMKHATIALLHDIGKSECGILNLETKKVSYPFHGEMASGLLLQLWSQNFGAPFTKIVWEEICRTICVHMCGHHLIDFNDDNAQYKLNMLSCESPTVKNNLIFLSYGDYLGAIKNANINEFSTSRCTFKTLINKTEDSNKLMKINKFNGIVIFIRGQYQSGKSQLLEQIKVSFDNKKVEYIAIPQIKHNTSINIEQGLKTNKVVLIELSSQYSYSPDALNMYLPNCIFDALVISIDVIRNFAFDNTQNMNNLGNYKKTVTTWLPETASINYKNFSSYSTSQYFSANHEQIFAKSRPKLCFTVAFNQFGNIGYFELFRQLDYFTSSFVVRALSPLEFLMQQNDVNNSVHHLNDVPTDTNQMNIIQYCNMLYNTTSWDTMIEIIRSQCFMIGYPPQFKATQYEKRIIKIKYLEHNRLWKAKWSRQCRGVILFINDDNKIVPLKYLLQRGAEVLMPLHTANGVDATNDATLAETSSTITSSTIFDDVQQSVMNKLSSNQDIDGVLSFKSDGSLLGITYYFGEYKKFAEDFICKCGDEFAQTFHGLFNKYSNLNSNNLDNNSYTCIASSQGTFSMGNDMQPYNVTAILGDLYDQSELCTIATKYPNYCEALFVHGIEWVKSVSKIVDYLYATHTDAISITLNFESICKNRTSLWETIPHTELAISYPRSMTRFLGASICTNNNVKFIPHFDISNVLTLDIKEPLYWRVSHASKINAMLTDLELIIMGKLSKELFVVKHKPYNKNNKNNEVDTILDLEGFIFFTKVENSHEYDYGKIKTATYYKSHNFKFKNIPYLIAIADTCGDIFPLAARVKNFCESTPEKLSVALLAIKNELFKPTEPLGSNNLFDKLPEKAKKTFGTKSAETKIKMLINGSSAFADMSCTIFAAYFTDLERQANIDKAKEISSTIKALVMKLELWKNQDINVVVENYVKNMNTNTELQELLGFCINS